MEGLLSIRCVIFFPSLLFVADSLSLSTSLPLGEGGLFAKQMVDEVSGMNN